MIFSNNQFKSPNNNVLKLSKKKKRNNTRAFLLIQWKNVKMGFHMAEEDKEGSLGIRWKVDGVWRKLRGMRSVPCRHVVVAEICDCDFYTSLSIPFRFQNPIPRPPTLYVFVRDQANSTFSILWKQISKFDHFKHTKEKKKIKLPTW